MPCVRMIPPTFIFSPSSLHFTRVPSLGPVRRRFQVPLALKCHIYLLEHRISVEKEMALLPKSFARMISVLRGRVGQKTDAWPSVSSALRDLSALFGTEGYGGSTCMADYFWTRTSRRSFRFAAIYHSLDPVINGIPNGIDKDLSTSTTLRFSVVHLRIPNL